MTVPAATHVSVPRRARGFTLIEILVVITIIALLMGFTGMFVMKFREAGRITEAQARISSLALMAESYADMNGAYPPSDLGALGAKGANGVNAGIEACLAALRHRDYSGERPSEAWLGNTDSDTAEGLGSYDGSNALLEVVDPWDNPFSYLLADDYGKYGTYRLGDDRAFEDVDVGALRNELTGAWHMFESFQIRSAGPDGLFDTEDDLANFEIELQDDA